MHAINSTPSQLADSMSNSLECESEIASVNTAVRAVTECSTMSCTCMATRDNTIQEEVVPRDVASVPEVTSRDVIVQPEVNEELRDDELIEALAGWEEDGVG